MADNTPKEEPKAGDEIAALQAQINALTALIGKQAPVSAPLEPAEKLTETIPGGAYFLSDGKTLVNAYGRKIDKEGKPLSNDDAYLEQIVIVR
jgi:hypothetical protein